MGAAPHHIAKYTETYKHLFPGAGILLIQSCLPAMLWGTDLTAALDIVKKYIDGRKAKQGGSSRSGIILQMSSNGGASSATSLTRALQQSNLQLPLDAVILDCSPGKLSLLSSTRAVTLQLSNSAIIRVVGAWLTYVFFGFYMIMKMALRVKDDITRVRLDLNDPALFTRDTPRLYLYSKADTLIEWKHVEDHAREAEILGYNVRVEVFEKAPHCALVKEDSERYWKAIQDLV